MVDQKTSIIKSKIFARKIRICLWTKILQQNDDENYVLLISWKVKEEKLLKILTRAGIIRKQYL